MSVQKVWGVKRRSKFFLNLSSSMPRRTGSFRVTPWYPFNQSPSHALLTLSILPTKTSSPCFFFKRHNASHRYLLDRTYTFYGVSLGIIVLQSLVEAGITNTLPYCLLLICYVHISYSRVWYTQHYTTKERYAD